MPIVGAVELVKMFGQVRGPQKRAVCRDKLERNSIEGKSGGATALHQSCVVSSGQDPQTFLKCCVDLEHAIHKVRKLCRSVGIVGLLELIPQHNQISDSGVGTN